jgi:DNA topoisomerase-3
MRLILCEKPSQARDIARFLGVVKEERTHIETRGGTVSWAFGHLLELVDFASYDPVYKSSWRAHFESLPCVPEAFILEPKQNSRSQLAAVGSLLKRAGPVVIATDPDREGEMIAREILDHHNYKGQVLRLWLKGLDEANIRKAFSALRQDHETKSLYHAARARSQADWLVGLNMTRVLTVQCGTIETKVLSIGRVQTPTLALVVRRDREIESFRVRDYYEIVAFVGTPEGVSVVLRHAPREEERIFDRTKAESVARQAQGVTAPLEVTKTVEHTSPPKLFSLAGFQKAANNRWGWSAAHALEILQALYERHKATTYPRSDCPFLPGEQVADVPKIVSNLRAVSELASIPVPAKPVIRKTVFNSAKVSAHHAIIPTTAVPDLAAMSGDQRNAFALIARHYLASLMPDYEYERTTITLTAGVDFTASGNVPQRLGWKAAFGGGEVVEEEKPEEPTLPSIGNGTPGTVERAIVETKQTRPPKRYTEATLLADMESIAKFVTDPAKKAMLKADPELGKQGGLGTEATRAEILETLIKRRGFIKKEKKNLISTPSGRRLIEIVEGHLPALADPVETALWEEQLSGIVEGRKEAGDFVRDIGCRLREYINTLRSAVAAPRLRSAGNSPHQSVPRTREPTGVFYKGKEFVDCGTYWQCEAIEGFFNKRLAQRDMQLSEYLAILEAKKAGVLFNFISGRTKKPYKAQLVYVSKTKFSGRPGIEMVFLDSKRETLCKSQGRTISPPGR